MPMNVKAQTVDYTDGGSSFHLYCRKQNNPAATGLECLVQNDAWWLGY
jgi:hypothetical protein